MSIPRWPRNIVQQFARPLLVTTSRPLLQPLKILLMSFLFIICLFLSASDRWIGADSGSKLLTNLLLPSSNNAKFSTSRNCEFSFLISDITKLDYCLFCWLIRLAFLLIIKFLKPIITSPFILLCWWVVSKMMVVSDEVDVEQNNVRKLVPISRMEEVEKCNLCRREDFQIFELTHPRRSKSK